jgi:hypothetical protein
MPCLRANCSSASLSLSFSRSRRTISSGCNFSFAIVRFRHFLQPLIDGIEQLINRPQPALNIRFIGDHEALTFQLFIIFQLMLAAPVTSVVH